MSRDVVVALLLIVSLAGCQAPRPTAKAAPGVKASAPLAPAPMVARPATQPATAVVIEEPGSTPQSLANDAAAYARTIERQLEERRQAKPAEAKSIPVVPRAEGEDVRWLDSREFRLTLDPPIEPVHAVQLSAAPSLTWAATPFTGVPAAPEAKPVPATQPGDAPRPAPAPADELEGTLARQVRENPRDVIAHLDHQLLQFLRGQPVPQLSSIGTLSAEDREVVAAVMDALTNFRTNAKSAEGGISDRRVRPLIELSERLRAAANLRVLTAALCTRVDGFGIYEPADNRFPAGRESRVILYCEIENFASQLNAKNLWETRLTLETTLYDSRGTRVAFEERRPVVDLSRNRRRDFFARGIIRIPALPAGQYALTVTVTDTQANRIAETRVPVEVAGP